MVVVRARGSLNKSYRSIFIFVVINNVRSDIVKRVFTTFVIVYSNLARMFASIGWFMGSLSYETHYVPDVKYENY
jgi:hypothetical protein